MFWITATFLFSIAMIAVSYEGTKEDKKLFLPVLSVGYVIFTLGMSVIVVSPGSVRVLTWFGTVNEQVYVEGIHLVNPMASTVDMDIRRDTIDFSNNQAVGSVENPVNGPSILAISGDNNPLHIDVSVPYRIQSDYAWKLYQKIGKSDEIIERKFLETNVRAAVPDIIALHPWTDVAIQRDKIANTLLEKIQKRVIADLVTNGFTQSEAEKTFVFMTPQIREVRPDAKVLEAVAEKVATEQLKQKQEVLTEIARLQIDRKKFEGKAALEMFGDRPLKDIALMLSALAQKEQADALMEAVKSNNIKLMVIPTGTPVSVASE